MKKSIIVSLILALALSIAPLPSEAFWWWAGKAAKMVGRAINHLSPRSNIPFSTAVTKYDNDRFLVCVSYFDSYRD